MEFIPAEEELVNVINDRMRPYIEGEKTPVIDNTFLGFFGTGAFFGMRAENEDDVDELLGIEAVVTTSANATAEMAHPSPDVWSDNPHGKACPPAINGLLKQAEPGNSRILSCSRGNLPTAAS